MSTQHAKNQYEKDLMLPQAPYCKLGEGLLPQASYCKLGEGLLLLVQLMQDEGRAAGSPSAGQGRGTLSQLQVYRNMVTKQTQAFWASITHGTEVTEVLAQSTSFTGTVPDTYSRHTHPWVHLQLTHPCLTHQQQTRPPLTHPHLN